MLLFGGNSKLRIILTDYIINWLIGLMRYVNNNKSPLIFKLPQKIER